MRIDMESVKAVVQISVSDKAADIQEAVPTGDQLRSILEYLGPNKAGTVIEDATSTGDAIKKFKDNGSSIQRPITVDWNQGRVGRCTFLDPKSPPVRYPHMLMNSQLLAIMKARS